MRSRRGLAEAAGRWSATHRWTAVLVWLAFVVVATLLGSMAETKSPSAAQLANGEARQAEEILDRAGLTLPAHEVVLVQDPDGTVDSERFRAAVEDTVKALNGTGRTANVVSPLDPAGPAAVSADRHSALVQFDLAKGGPKAKDEVEPVLDAVAGVAKAHQGIRVEQFGDASFQHAYDAKLHTDYSNAETLSFPVTLGILFIAFGAAVAAVVPVLLAATVVTAAGGLVVLASQLVPIDQNGSSVMSLIGIAVGVDYSLFYLKRVREERARGRGTEAAVIAAAATSGRSVLVSGLTVIVALAGLYLSGNGIFLGMATATITVVAVAVVGSLTVLPALLSLLGHRIDKGRIPLRRRSAGSAAPAAGRVRTPLVDRVLRRPALWLSVCTAVLGALLVPALGLNTSDSGVGDLPADSLPALQTYQRIQQAFPGAGSPAKVVIKADGLSGTEGRAALERLRAAADSTPGLRGPVTFHAGADGTVGVATVALDGNGTDRASAAALATLRDTVVPTAFGALRGAEIAVGGTTAVSEDGRTHLSDSTPWVAGFVLLFTFGVMLFSFRSIVLAGLTLVLNLLSVGAAFGLIVLVFQNGWGEGLLGFTATGGIASWVPLFLFVFLFGLSMDYHVFVVSRIRENRDRGLSTVEAVADGVRGTAGAVTGAAVVMVAVAAVFGALPQLSMKESGVGMSVAVLLDATLVRIVLLPAALVLLGDRSWFLPRALSWIPVGGGHGDTAPESSERPAAPGRTAEEALV
ncbi:MMPL family transporter [Kitasatospora sp. NPDC056184]|uniref:MMPL family transporter n=1 Tax=Kitasatospora sp. NPDC056184 TaxID=3345738 RepID=UPI0035DB845A